MSTKYNPYHAKLAYWLAYAGLVDTQIAKELEISPRTLYNWRRKYPEFAEALESGKETPDAAVESALLRRALGYEYEEISEVREGGERLHVRATRKHMAPDVTACIFWLKNRRPERWRDVSRVEAEITDDKAKEAGRLLAENAEARELVKQAFRVIHGGGANRGE